MDKTLRQDCARGKEMTLQATSRPVGARPGRAASRPCCASRRRGPCCRISGAARLVRPGDADTAGFRRVWTALPRKPVKSVRKGELLASDGTRFVQGRPWPKPAQTWIALSEEQADATRDLERVRELYARTVASTTELDAAKLRHARASSGLAAAQARVERSRRNCWPMPNCARRSMRWSCNAMRNRDW
jgi:hypothetical protein